jgi:hypothetical protein
VVSTLPAMLITRTKISGAVKHLHSETFLKAINETITDYPADLVFKADRGD